MYQMGKFEPTGAFCAFIKLNKNMEINYVKVEGEFKKPKVSRLSGAYIHEDIMENRYIADDENRYIADEERTPDLPFANRYNKYNKHIICDNCGHQINK